MQTRYKRSPEFWTEQWFKNGDHAYDSSKDVKGSDGEIFLSEGKVVRRYRHPYLPWKDACKDCKMLMLHHGWIDSGGDGLTVCPGNWVLTPIKDAGNPKLAKVLTQAQFEELYERCPPE
jgi:hypothetical protein